MANLFKSPKLFSLWRSVRPWVTFLALLLVLRYTGILAGVSVFTNSALMNLGMLKAKPEALSGDEYLDYNFSVKTTGGETVDFNKFKGKTIFLNIWATWCGPCRAEMPSIQKLYESSNKENINFVMLSIDEEKFHEKVKRYAESNKFSFPVFIAGQLPGALQVQVIPTTFVIAPDGKIVYKKSGMANYNSAEFKKFLNDVSTSDN